MEKAKKTTIQLLVLCFAVAAVSTAVAILTTDTKKSNAPKKVTPTQIAFYGLDENYATAFKKVIDEHLSDLADSENQTPETEFVVLNRNESLEQQISDKTIMVITYMGLNSRKAAEKISKNKSGGVSWKALSTLTTSQQKLSKSYGEDREKVYVVPLLSDNAEIDINKLLLERTKTKRLATWEDIEAFALKSKEFVDYPVIFSGSNADSFLHMIGAYTEAVSGKKAYETTCRKINDFFAATPEPEEDDVLKLVKDLADTPASPLYATADFISRWYKKGLMHPDIFRLEDRDVETFMKNRSSSISFVTLSQHRSMSSDAFKYFVSIPRALNNNGNTAGYYPSYQDPATRNLMSDTICAVPVNSETAQNFVTLLTSDESQKTLSRITGLAPVNALCPCPDVEADDVRFWIAATNEPLIPLNRAAFASTRQMEIFSKVLANYIKHR